ncbi:UxaA family hydrolase, partial [Escherichia coli]|nr:UxaA family hydrolase [Escherichia coli]
MNNTLMGYRRENGKVGIRNHVIILPVDDISNA